MNLTDPIESAEHQFKHILEEFFISVYDKESLSSHGIDHHRRVWCYAKELFKVFPDQKPGLITQFPSKLIIACYLHDIGMSVESGVRHGKHSKDLCIKFLAKNHLNENDYPDVLDAIENHDRKDYQGNSGINDLLTILSVADDLDAFGFTGIFRYSEIYLTRGINLMEIGQMIQVNAVKRFDNFIKTFGFIDTLVLDHTIRYEILNDFWSEYNKQIASYQFGGEHPTGYCGIIELIDELIKRKTTLKQMFSGPYMKSDDPVIRWFINGLISESVYFP